MNTEAIVQLRTDLKAEGAARHAKYDMLMAASGGDYETRRLEAIWKTFQQFVGIDRSIAMDRETFEFRLNLIPSVIRSSRAFISTVPTVRCPPAKPDDKASRTLAEKQERVFSGFWQASLIGRRMNQMGYWNPQLGNTIGVVWPDVDKKRPLLQMRSPYGFYPVIRDIDGFDLSCAIFTTKYPWRQLKAMYPGLKMNESGMYGEVTQYIDEKQIVTIVADQHRVNEIENKCGFVPIVIIPNESFGEGPWGESDIEWIIPLQAEHNYRQTMQNAIMAMVQMQPLVVEGGTLAPEEIGMGMLDVVPVEPGGKVYRSQPPQIPYQIFQAQSDLVKMIDRVGQVPPVMQGQYASSGQTTGRAVSALLGPTQMAFNIKGNEIYPALAALNKMAMRMWDAMWPKDEHTVYSMDSKNHMSVEKFRTEEFDGWYENIVTVDTASYFDAQSKFVMNLQAVQNRLKSRQLAASETPGVDDAVADQIQVAKELQEDMDVQAANAARAQNNIQPDMASQGATNANLSKGYAGETPVPPSPGGFDAQSPPGTAPGETPTEAPPEEAPGGLVDMFIEFFQDLPLKGKVWLAGSIVTNPAYSPQSPDWNGVEVFLESANDKAAINASMRKDFPEVWGNLVYHTGEPSQDEPSILVFDPAGEQAPDELFGEDMPPEGMPPEGGAPTGMPPDIAAMMGGANEPLA